MMDTLTISALAQEAYDAMERRTRDDGTDYYARKDDAPEWLGDLCRDAHGEMLPDDWRYDAIHSALGHIADSGADDTDDLDDAGHEFADGHVDVYNGPRAAWLASHSYRAAYTDDAVSELGGEGLDTYERIGLGQYAESLEVFESVRQSLADEMERREDEQDDA